MRFADIFDFKGFIDMLTGTGLKWLAIIAAVLGFLLISFIGLSGTGLPTLLFIVGITLMFTYPVYLIMKLAGTRKFTDIIKFWIVSFILQMVGLALLGPDLALLVGVGAFILAIGLVFPKRVTLVDAIILYVVLGVLGVVLLLLTGATLFGALLFGESITQAITALS